MPAPKGNKNAAYDTGQLKEQSLKAIREHSLYFISDVVAYLPCSKPTFYEHFPVNSNDFNEIKSELYQNRVDAKVEMRKKWLKSDNATMQMGLMKLLSEDEELKKLAMEYKEHSGKVKFDKIQVDIVEADE